MMKTTPLRWALLPALWLLPALTIPTQRAQGAADPADPYFPVAQKVASLPAWVFHGGSDSTVPVSESRRMAALPLSMKADLRYTEYPGVGHSSWDYAYKETGLLPWLLAHRRGR